MRVRRCAAIVIAGGFFAVALGGCAESRDVNESGDVDEGAPEAMGIDSVDWPTDVEGARALFERMPERLGDLQVEHPDFGENATGVEYRAGDTSAIAWVMGTDETITEPTGVLGVMFTLGAACEPETYIGTAPPSPEGYGPAFEEEGATPGEGLWWFSCTVLAVEGDDPNFAGGHAVGWVSGDTGWLTMSPDERTAQSLIDALIGAR